ncbi:MAG: hypothetical protein P8078_07245, partial [bacterium]
MHSGSRKKSQHLLRKIVIIFFLIILSLFLFLILFLRYFFPQEQLKHYTEKSLSQALEKPVEIKKLMVNPFGSITIQDFSLIQPSDQEGKIDTLFRVKEIILKYKFFSLFKRRLWISRVLIDSPEFIILSSSPTSQSSALKEKEKIIPPSSPKNTVKKTDSSLLLPFTFLMSIFELKDCTFSLISNNSQGKTAFTISGLNLNISKVNLPRNFLKDRQWIRGTLQLFTREGNITVRSRKSSYQLTGSVKNLSTFDLTLSSGTIDLNQTLKHYENLFSDFALNFFNKISIKGTCDPIKGKIQGTSDSLRLEIESRLNLNKFLLTADSSFMENGFVEFSATGLASLEKIEDMKIKGKIGYDSFSKNMGDTLTLQTGKLSCVFNTSLNSHLFPYIGDLHCSLNDLMRGNTELNINWFSKPGVLPNRKNLIVKARLQADSLNLDYLPYPLPDTKGKVSFDLALLSLGGRHNKVTLNCRLDSTRYNQELIGTGEHNLKANIFIRIDETQSEFFMDTCLVALDKVLACQLQGYYGTESQKINLDLQQATIDNAELISFFPQNIAQNLTLSGYENIQASVMFTSLPERFSSFSASIGFLSTGLNLFPQRIFINDLQGKVDFRGSLKNIRGEGNMVVNTIRIPELRSSPLEDSSIDLKVELDSLTTVLLNTVVISLPSLKFGGEINGSLQNLTSVSSARIKGKAAFAFDSPDTVEIINNILITGKIMTNLQAATNDSTNSNIHITGSLGTESLAIHSKNNFRIGNIQSSLPFSFNYDLNTKLLVKSPADSIPLKNNYRNKRFLYHSLFPEIGRLTLESVQISNYQIDRIDTDILCSGNRIQLPWIGINLFDGIIAGDLYLNL